MSTATAIESGPYNSFLYPAHEIAQQMLELYGYGASLAIESLLKPGAEMARLWQVPFAADTLNVLNAAQAMYGRMSQRYERTGFNIGNVVIDGEIVDVRENVIVDRPHCNLLHFERETARNDPPILIGAPRSGHYPDLLRDTVKQLLPSHDVYITDTKNARDVPIDQGDYGLDDNAEDYINFIKALGPDTNILAICQATVPAMMAVAYLAKHEPEAAPASLTLMSGPLNPAAAPTEVTKFADSVSIDWLRQNFIAKVPAGYAGVGREIFPGFLQIGNFMLMNPDKHIQKHIDLYYAYVDCDINPDSQKTIEKIERFYNEYFVPSDTTAKFYLETVGRAFKNRELATGQAHLRSERLEPAAINNTSVLTIECENDDISAPGQTAAVHAWLANLPAERQYHYLQPGAGHYGGFSGKKWADEIAPRFTGFIRGEAQRRKLTYDEAASPSMIPDLYRS